MVKLESKRPLVVRWPALLDGHDGEGDPSHKQLAEQLFELIQNRTIVAGELLPSSIELEQSSGINRGVFVRAFRLLHAAGVLKRAPEGWLVVDRHARP
jgi:DNA-binding GntR family transcriptional regulator